MKAQNNAPSFYHKKNNLQIFGSFYSDHYGAKLDTNEVKTYGIGGEIGYGGGRYKVRTVNVQLKEFLSMKFHSAG